jgi:RNA ligase (TIGR02306 family)
MAIRKLASIVEITSIKPIPDADAIECAIVNGGWPVVVKKDTYKVGTLAVYFEIDSWVPYELAPFLSKGREPSQYNGVKGERLRTVKLRGQISQGLLLNINDIKHQIVVDGYDYTFDMVTWELGEDVSSYLNIQKWEPPVPAQLRGLAKGNFPSFIPKTDQERCQNLYKEIFEKHKDEVYEVTTKLDGSSMTVYFTNNSIGVCSRNIDLKETEDNSFWQAARKQNIIDAMLAICSQHDKEYAIQGELIGHGIQGNPEKLEGQRFYLFDVFNITDDHYLKPLDRYEIQKQLKYTYGADIETVPVIDTAFCLTKHFSTIDEILDFAEGSSLNSEVKREGLVFKSHTSAFTFKAIANSYLLSNRDS